MSHRHICLFNFHSWECEGKALRCGDREPSVCLCPACESPMEEGDHSRCQGPVEIVTCPAHIDEEHRWRVEMKPRFAAHFKRRKAEWDMRHGSTPESEQLFEKLMKNLGSESCQRAFLYGHEGGWIGHPHFCDVADHWWDCKGAALRPGDKEPSVCVCHSCRAPLEQGDHRRCKNLVEIVACPEHRDQQLRMREEAERDFERRAAEFRFDEKWARMKALPVGPEKDALAEEIVEWLFR